MQHKIHNRNMSDAIHSDRYSPSSSGAAAPRSPKRNRLHVVHTYHDLSRYLQEGGIVVKHKKSSSNFPAKLHQILSEPQFSHIIVWMVRRCVFLLCICCTNISILECEVLAHQMMCVPELFSVNSHMAAPGRY